MRKSAVAHDAAKALSDVTLTGSVARVDISGSATRQLTIQATSVGRSSVVITGESDAIRETTAISKAGPAKTWNLSAATSALAGTPQTASASSTRSSSEVVPPQTSTVQNPNGSKLFAAIGWFFPYLSIRASHAAADNLVFSPSVHPGDDPKDIHIAMRWKASTLSEDTYRLHAGTLPDSVTIDPDTMLVKSALFMMVQHSRIKKTPWTTQHPAFEEKVDYSDYQKVEGVPVPMHIQVSINRRPVYDIHLDSVSLNTGITIATPEEK